MRVVEANVNDESGPYGFYNPSAVLWSSREIGRSMRAGIENRSIPVY
jgi:hypothetical protein